MENSRTASKSVVQSLFTLSGPLSLSWADCHGDLSLLILLRSKLGDILAGKRGLSPCPTSGIETADMPTGFGGHGAKSAFAHLTELRPMRFEFRNRRPNVR